MNAFIDCPDAPLDPPEDDYEEERNEFDDTEYDLQEDK